MELKDQIIQEYLSTGFDTPELTALFSDMAGNIFGIYQQPTKEKYKTKRHEII